MTKRDWDLLPCLIVLIICGSAVIWHELSPFIKPPTAPPAFYSGSYRAVQLDGFTREWTMGTDMIPSGAFSATSTWQRCDGPAPDDSYCVKAYLLYWSGHGSIDSQGKLSLEKGITQEEFLKGAIVKMLEWQRVQDLQCEREKQSITDAWRKSLEDDHPKHTPTVTINRNIYSRNLADSFTGKVHVGNTEVHP